MSRQDDGRSYGLKAPGNLVIGSSCVRSTISLCPGVEACFRQKMVGPDGGSRVV